MEQARVCKFNDQTLRFKLVRAQMRLRIAALIAKRLDLRKPITVREFLEQVIQVERAGLGVSDLTIIGECFGLGSNAIRSDALAMVAEGRAILDQSFRFCPNP